MNRVVYLLNVFFMTTLVGIRGRLRRESENEYAAYFRWKPYIVAKDISSG